MSDALIHSSRFKLGRLSMANLIGVHTRLVAVVRMAIRLSAVDFRVTDGIRSISEQRRLVAKGVSRTMRSRHLVQKDGHGHAVDLVPWIDGQLSWDWQACCEVAAAMRQSADRLHLSLRWGGAWDRRLSDLGDEAETLDRARKQYAERQASAGRTAFLDGVHFETIDST